MNFLVKNQDNFKTNSSVHSIDTRNKDHFHIPFANLSCFQKSAFYSDIRILNNLYHIKGKRRKAVPLQA